MFNKSILKARYGSLLLAVLFLAIPGIKGHEIYLAGLHLGRVQPFKYFFLIWLCIEGIYLARTYTWSQLLGRLRSSASIWILILLFDVVLAIATVGQPGPNRGPATLVAMALGQVAALFTYLDDEFPFRAFFKGICIAAIILAVFAVFEKVAPGSFVTQLVMNYFRDEQVMGWQVGSSLTTSGLAEFCIRLFPIVLACLAFTVENWVTCLLLLFMGIATIERNAALSIGLIICVALATPVAKRYRKIAALTLVVLVVGAAALAGPQIMFAKYFGAFQSNPTDNYAYSAKNTLKIRGEMWHKAFKAIQYAPLKGIGMDGFSFRNLNSLPPFEHDTASPDGRHCHNMFLEFGVSGGVIALLLWVSIVGIYAGGALLASPKRWTAILYFIGQVPSMMTDVRIYVSWLAITLFWFAAIAWKAGRLQMGRKSESHSDPVQG